MTTQIKRRRGTTLQHSTFAGAEAEITIDTDKNTVVVHDGSTAGGHPLAKASEVVAKAGDTMTGDLSFGDNDKAIFGAGSDLQIYSDGNTSFIKESGAGNFAIDGTNIFVRNGAGTANMASFVDGGAASLYHNSTARLDTTSTGVDVTGTVTADGLTVEQNVGSKITFSSTDVAIAGGEVIGEIDFYSSDASGIGAASRANISAVAADAAGAGDVYIKTSTGGAAIANRLKVANNGDISFYEDTGTTPKFFWDASDESLGIGTSSPSAPLHINGGSANVVLKATNSSNTTGLFVGARDGAFGSIFSAGDGYIYQGGGQNLSMTADGGGVVRFGTGSTERMRITSTGSVGIGTNSPASALDVVGTVTADGLTVDGVARIQGAATGLVINENDTVDLNTYLNSNTGDFRVLTVNDAFTIFKERINVDHATGDISFYEDTGTTPKFFWDASAESLGIGTTNAAYDLTVQGASNLSTIGTNSGALRLRADGAWSMQFYTDSSEVMRITAAGNVGIGTSSPDGALHVKDAIAQVYIQSDDGQPAQIVFGDVSDASNGRINYNASDNMIFEVSNLTEAMRIDSSGNLLVGTTSTPGASSAGCAIRGSSEDILKSTSLTTSKNQVVFYNPNGAVGTINTNGSATTYNTSSDYRLKEDVHPMSGASDRLMQLNPVNFAWKADGTRVDGFLAHEAQAVVPEAVTGEKDAVDAEGNPEYQGIDQSKLVPLLTAALQEALTEIADLKARVAALEA